MNLRAEDIGEVIDTYERLRKKRFPDEDHLSLNYISRELFADWIEAEASRTFSYGTGALLPQIDLDPEFYEDLIAELNKKGIAAQALKDSKVIIQKGDNHTLDIYKLYDLYKLSKQQESGRGAER